MKKEYIRFGIIFLVIVIFAVFVYPTLYKYDKLNQRLPVKINRITGKTEVLSGTTWMSIGHEASASEVDKIREEINASIQNDHEKTKQEVKEEITAQIVQELRDEIELLKQEIISAKAEIEVYKQFETDPSNYFTIGDTVETVKGIMGTPDSIRKDEHFNEEFWMYGTASITFQKGKVKEWRDFGNVLRTK